MKKIFLPKDYYIEEEVLKALGFIRTLNIVESDIVVEDISAKDYLFEPSIEAVYNIAFAQSRNKKIITFGLMEEKIKEKLLVTDIRENENNLLILKDVELVFDGENCDVGDFLYENVYGNGMLVYNNSILNIYDDYLEKILEVAYCYVNEDVDFTLLKEFKGFADVNAYINKVYEDIDVYTQKKLPEEKNFSESQEDKDLCYLIGPDVFCVSNVKDDELLKLSLLRDRKAHSKALGINSETPLEFGEETSYNLGEVIKGNNRLARVCNLFTANLITMPLEKEMVDSGSLYEVFLNLFMGGSGVINVSETFPSALLLIMNEEFKERVIIHKNASNQVMSESLSSLT